MVQNGKVDKTFLTNFELFLKEQVESLQNIQKQNNIEMFCNFFLFSYK